MKDLYTESVELQNGAARGAGKMKFSHSVIFKKEK